MLSFFLYVWRILDRFSSPAGCQRLLLGYWTVWSSVTARTLSIYATVGIKSIIWPDCISLFLLGPFISDDCQASQPLLLARILASDLAHELFDRLKITLFQNTRVVVTTRQWFPDLAWGGRYFKQSLHVARPSITRVSNV